MLVPADTAPRYSVVEATIRAQIEDGALVAGDKLPREVELAERFGVSRSVIRQAIGNLERDGLVVRLRAKGTFITEPPLSMPVYRICSFSEELTRSGLEPSAKVLAFERRPVPPGVADLLHIPAHTPIPYVERLRLGGDTVLCHDTTWVHPSLAWCVDAIDLEKETLFEAYQRIGGHTIGGLEREVRARVANDQLAAQLDILAGGAVLEVQRIVRDPSGHPMDVQIRYYRGDRFSLRLDSAEQGGDQARPIIDDADI